MSPIGKRLGSPLAVLVSSACLWERINKGRQNPLILHADNGTPSRRLLEELLAATLESRLEELDVLRAFSRPRLSNDNPYSESPFRTVKYRPDYPLRPFDTLDNNACALVTTFMV